MNSFEEIKLAIKKYCYELDLATDNRKDDLDFMYDCVKSDPGTIVFAGENIQSFVSEYSDDIQEQAQMFMQFVEYQREMERDIRSVRIETSKKTAFYL